MPTSRNHKRAAVLRRRIVLVCLALVAIAVLNAGLTFVLEPYGSKSEVAWTDYKKEPELDTIIVGSSLVQRAIDPKALDAAYGSQSYNLATPDQALEDSFIAIQTAYEDHGITRAILGLGPNSMLQEGAPNPGSPYLTIRSRFVSPRQAFSALGQTLFRYGAWKEPVSLNWIFPWVKHHASADPREIGKNVQMKIDGTSLYEGVLDTEPQWVYVGKGYGSHDRVLDYNGTRVEKPYFDRDFDARELDADRCRTLEDICAYCAERDIDLVVMCAPMPVFNILDNQEAYDAVQTQVKDLLAVQNVAFYDFNYARPELFDDSPELYSDSEHLNIAGGAAFTTSFARFLGMRDAVLGGNLAQEELDEQFYQPKEWQASIDYISAVVVDYHGEDDGLHIEPRALAGSAVVVEYQICVKNGDSWDVLRDWDTEPHFVWHPGSQGVFKMRVNARQANNPNDTDHYREFAGLW